MTDRANQHFVPQFYFRNFSTTGRTIGTLLIRKGTVIPNASIKGQCARRNFYGPKEVESVFSKLESRHSAGIRAALKVASVSSAPFFSPQELMWFLESIVFQRGRTALEIEKTSPAMEKWFLAMFRHHLMHHDDAKNRDEIIGHIDAGHVRITEGPHVTISRVLSIALESASLITDMHLCLLRNRTDYPFIFSDAPVVFYNTYCKNVRNRGVLGLQCPGLQIFYPLNAWTCALLLDDEKYQGPFRGYIQYDLHLRSDISQINALQLYHSLDTVYFGNAEHQDYVRDLWQAHRRSLAIPRSKFCTNADFLIDGTRPEGDLFHMFEPQLDYDLELSFIDCSPVAEVDYVYAPRSPELRHSRKE